MLRLMNVLAIVVLIGSAVYAYSIKYATLYQVEKVARLKRELQAEKNGLAMARAEWAHVAAPVRIEALADQYLGGQVMQLSQIASLASLPDRGPSTDEIGAELKQLGLGSPVTTPGAAGATATPATVPAQTGPGASASSRTGR
ncbi:hypothetical protein K9U39_10125 [Rhodoblastus acidophilus]|uniref:Cell division protein FtsL n=1 Tax=Candidatus Rhodoblastus alkanivorans TaxID=2954117 RepID=A0ABS9Z9E6_9HYPH|nr:hypothetical protein [Candidatus Rhodoblastus alkanivorans]MCI4680567.1 hypothetical protein [Candidatus Rhodoblastus alkanivorans]MCI4683970.1 hypothetical protein [Candidatus Rhodoblastus alkanivorans]MDI4641289.1 hypothetical protein [Rhodoblastus acidophilus]